MPLPSRLSTLCKKTRCDPQMMVNKAALLGLVGNDCKAHCQIRNPSTANSFWHSHNHCSMLTVYLGVYKRPICSLKYLLMLNTSSLG